MEIEPAIINTDIFVLRLYVREGVVGVPKMSGQMSGKSSRHQTRKRFYIHICPKKLSSRGAAYQSVDFSPFSVYL